MHKAPDRFMRITLPSPLPSHPRLLARASDWQRLKKQVDQDAPSRRIWATLVRRAESILARPILTRAISDTRSLLMVAREALERISVLALVARVGGDQRYASRAIDEVMSLCSFSDWGPRSFLDVAETCLAVSLGYDWLYDDLTADQRETIAAALISKAIAPSLDENAKGNWWITTNENWAQVCHGGLSAAAIVLADREPELAQRIIERAIDNLPRVAATYAPDGAYPEGPMYWSYGTGYHVILAAALLRFAGTTFGIDAYDGFEETADYINQVTAPSGDYFNYCDCAPRRRLQAQLFWMADRFNRPDWLTHDIATLDGDLMEYERDPGVQYWYYDMAALALLWYNPHLAKEPRGAASSWFGNGKMPVAIYRQTMPNRSPFYFAIKGGTVGSSHSHMDVGSFVLEAEGERWAVDPGMQDYASLERHGVDLWNETDPESQRWQIFRIGPQSHSILRFDGIPQALLSTAPIVEQGPTGCSIDLTPLYAPRLLSVSRRVDLGPFTFRMTDTWSAAEPTVAIWQWMTFASVETQGSSIRLSQNGKSIRIDISCSVDSSITCDDLSLPRRVFDAPNPGLKRVTLVTRPSLGGTIATETILEPAH